MGVEILHTIRHEKQKREKSKKGEDKNRQGDRAAKPTA
ncbi:hypothetical protein D187_004477 [Cystobacter fuscus DSM 2262]|uniref:Uncharacterized protein n=1 Tax=Cystobacter fuscus (strain ATCC 25194 / DSM 2262 / NBRC 100088 / M29) TaxID=1242864 RepID=S9QN18_CYSF2|nr:hypothetical protein D187_004477 [Cystobacter fuscus DSM 2262]